MYLYVAVINTTPSHIRLMIGLLFCHHPINTALSQSINLILVALSDLRVIMIKVPTEKAVRHFQYYPLNLMSRASMLYHADGNFLMRRFDFEV